MEVSEQLHAPFALPPGKESRAPMGQKTICSPDPVWTRWRRKKSLPCPTRESNPSRPAAVLLTLLTEPSRIDDTVLISMIYAEYETAINSFWALSADGNKETSVSHVSALNCCPTLRPKNWVRHVHSYKTTNFVGLQFFFFILTAHDCRQHCHVFG
jgi:hypothetical protein